MARRTHPLLAVLRDIRIEQGLTQAELAAQAGVHSITIANWEQGRNQPVLDTLVLVAGVLGYDLALDPRGGEA